MKYDYILFDLDGTIVDSGEGITKSAQYALSKFGIHAELDELKRFVGPPAGDCYKKFYGFDDEKADEALRYYRARYNEKGIFELKLYDGIRELLCELRDRGAKVVLATSKPQVFAERILSDCGITECFAVICGGTLYGMHETKSMIVANAMKAVGADPGRTVMVGDSFYDIVGAHDNGIPVIGVSYGYGLLEDLKKHAADVIVDDVASLAKELLAD